MKKNISVSVRLKTFFLSFFQLQLFLTLISWPILIYSGLPISLMCPLGNLLFTPLITLYLLLSSLIFFSELLFIPNYYLIFLLEKLTKLWVIFTTASSPAWLIGIPSISLLILICLPIVTVALMLYKPLGTQKKNIVSLLLLMLAFGSIVCLVKKVQKPLIREISCQHKQKIFYYVAQRKALVIGATGLQQQMVEEWIDYNLLPELIKATGSHKVDYLIIKEPKKSAFDFATELAKREMFKDVYIHTWKKDDSDKKLSCAYMNMKNMLVSHGIRIHYFKDVLFLEIGQDYNIEIADKTPPILVRTPDKLFDDESMK